MPKSFVITGSQDSTVNIYDLVTGTKISTLEGHKASVNALKISYDGIILATGDLNGIARVWSIEKATCIREYIVDSSISVVDFAYDKFYLLIGSEDGLIRMYSLVNSTLVHTFIGHFGPVRSMKCGNHLLVSGSDDTTARNWDIGTVIENYEKQTVQSLKNSYLIESETILKFYYPNVANRLTNIEINSNKEKCNNCKEESNKEKQNYYFKFGSVFSEETTVTAVELVDDESFWIFGGTEGNVYVINSLDNSQKYKFEDHDASIVSIKYITNNNSYFLVTASKDGSVIIYDFMSGELLKILKISNSLSKVQIGSNARLYLINQESSKDAYIYDYKSNHRISYSGNESKINAIEGFSAIDIDTLIRDHYFKDYYYEDNMLDI